MKIRAMKFLRSALSVLLACSMIAGLGITTFAAEPEEDAIRYVSIGDSTTNGYGLEGYAEATLGYGYAPADSYPAQVAEHYGWELTQLAISGMRSTELYCLLDSSYAGDDYTAKVFTGKGNAFDQAAGKTNGTGAATLRMAYKEAITNADVISINIGSEDLGGYLIERVLWAINEHYGMDMGGVYYAGDPDDLANTTDDQALLVALSVQLTAMFGASESELVDEIVDAMLYGTLSLMQNYTAALEVIRQWNPDAEIIVVGLSNPVEGLDITMAETGEDLELTEVFDILVEMINSCLLSVEENSEHTYYAEPGQVSLIVEDIAALKTDVEFDCSDELESCMIAEVADRLVGAMLSDGSSSEGTVATLATELLNGMKSEEDIAQGVACYYDYCEGSHKIYGCDCTDKLTVSSFSLCRKVLVGAAYLGLRDALIASAGEDDVNGVAVETMLISGQSPADLVLQSITAALPSLSLSTIMSGLPQAFRSAFANGFMENEGIYDLLVLFTHMAMGDSIGAHANAAGHIAIANAIVEAYDGQINPANEPGGYYLCQENYYVSLGGGTAYGSGLANKDKDYADLLIEAFGLEKGQYKEWGVKGLRIEDVRAIVDSTYEADAYGKAILADVDTAAYVAEIKKATIITLSLDCGDFMAFAVSRMSKGYELDWDRYLGSDTKVSLLSRIETQSAAIAEEIGLPQSQVKIILESYLYAAVGFACSYSDTLDAIRALNPNATLVLVGMYNPVDGISFGSGDNAMDLGELMQTLVDLTDMCYGMYAAMHEDTVYVSVSDTQSGDLGGGSASDLLAKLLKTNGLDVLYATVEGHAYIAQQVLASVAITEHNYSGVVTDPTCTAKGYTTYTCKCCGHVEKGDYTAAAGHQYELVVTDPTCTEKGYTTHTCTVCGSSYKSDYTDTYCPSADYADVEGPGYWYHEAIDFVVSKGLMKGTNKGFEPTLNIDRASFVTILYRMAGSPEVTGTLEFTDTDPDAWYATAVLWAVQTGVTTGTGNGSTFSPSDEITREQLVTLLYRFCVKVMGYDLEAADSVDLTAYPDYDEIDSWALEAVQWACNLGIITGRGVSGVSYLAPLGNAGRHEIATIMMRFYPMVEA